MKSATIILALIYIALSCVVPAAADSPWPMFRHDSAHSALTRYSGPAEPTVLWTFSAKDGIASSPGIGPDGTVYIGAGWDFRGVTDAALYAVNPDGTLKWRFDMEDGTESSPA